jgi:hypothetical protein
MGSYVRPFALVALLVSAGCESDFENARRVASFNEAGKVLVSLFTVHDFRDPRVKVLGSDGKTEVQLAYGLRPRFTLSSDKAVENAVPTTTFAESSLLTAVAMKIAGATTSVPGAEAPTPPEPKAATPTLEPGRRPQLHTNPEKPPLPVDPLFKYAAATALYQQTRLTDAAIEAVLHAKGNRALLAPLNIDVLPFAQRQPYDVHLSIHFSVMTDSTRPLHVTVLPLLVADNAEGVQTARTVELLIQAQLALKAMSAGGGFLFDGALTRQKVQSALGTDLNSLLTVGRVANNMLSVRIGAQRSANSTYATVTRNTTVWTLLLVSETDDHKRIVPVVPTGYWSIKAVSHATLRDAQNGTVLPYDIAREQALFRSIVERLASTAGCRSALLADGHERLRLIRHDALEQQGDDNWKKYLPAECATHNHLLEQMLPTALLETLGSSDYATATQRIWWSTPPADR